MKLPHRISILFFVLTLLSGTAALAQDKAANIDAVLRKFNEYGQFNGTALVAENGRVIYKKGIGLANMEWSIPNEPDTKFRLGSITKQFTAAVIMQLVEQGKIKLDGKITDYLPDYRADTGGKVTIHQLLDHTSGIPSYTGQPGFFANVSRNPFTVPDFIAKYASGDLEFEPGSKFNYNNSGYFLLGAIIEKVTGKTYDQVLKENIFTPLGMTNSGYDTAAPLIAKRASGYVKVPNGYSNAPYLDMSIPYAAGSLYSTVEDLYLWDQALYSDKVLTAKSRDLMFKPNLDNYGYGFDTKAVTLSDKTTVPTINHGGGINGFNTNIYRFVSDRHLIVLLDNTSQGRYQPAMIRAIANILYGKQFEMPKRPIGETVLATIKDKGVEAGIKQYRDLKATAAAQYTFGEEELNAVGYQLLQRGKTADAIEIFKLNVEMFPQASNPYDSLGEAYATSGDKDLAIRNYKRVLELDPKNANAAAWIKRLESPAAVVDPKQFDAYVGRYELAPEFVLAITVENGKLFGQATGQTKFEMTMVSETRFAVKVVGAEIEFVKDSSGAVTSLILHQGGRDMPGRRLP